MLTIPTEPFETDDIRLVCVLGQLRVQTRAITVLAGANVLSNCTQAPVFLLSHLMDRVAPPMGRSKRCMTDRVRGVIVTDTVVPYLPRRVACVKPYTRRGSEKVF